MQDCKPANTLIDVKHYIGSSPDSGKTDKGRYQHLVGKLIYLSHTRPDISYAVGVLSQFMHDPRVVHQQAAHKVLAYLKSTIGMGLSYKRGESLGMQIYTDAEYAGSIDDRRSTSGYGCLVGGNLITWRSQKQNVVARSNAEAEFRAMAVVICEGIWVRSILQDLGVFEEKPILLCCDNESAISIAHDPVQHNRIKHIEVDRHFIKEKLEAGMFRSEYVSSLNQLADILTKGLPTSIFEKLRSNLGMSNIDSPD